jgi:hypothetical protein
VREYWDYTMSLKEENEKTYKWILEEKKKNPS